MEVFEVRPSKVDSGSSLEEPIRSPCLRSSARKLPVASIVLSNTYRVAQSIVGELKLRPSYMFSARFYFV